MEPENVVHLAEAFEFLPKVRERASLRRRGLSHGHRHDERFSVLLVT
jgi:hypothetical protein